MNPILLAWVLIVGVAIGLAWVVYVIATAISNIRQTPITFTERKVSTCSCPYCGAALTIEEVEKMRDQA